MKSHGSLFSGIGGFDLAAQWMGWQNIFHCEWNEFGQKVLKHHFPQSISYGDITQTDFTIHRGQIDILSGGFPCQPYSAAGKRLGKEDDRHLWPEMLRATRGIRPGWVVGENVRGLTNWNGGVVFDEVQSDLEAEGYEVLPFLLPACAVNAPHRRDRIWFVAYCNNARADKYSGVNRTWDAADPGGEQLQERAPIGNGQDKEKERAGMDNRTERQGDTWDATYTDRRRQSGKEYGKRESGWIAEKSLYPDWQNFPTQSPVCNGDDGLSSRLDGITFPKWRNESIKAGGNAIVPQVVYQIFKSIESYDQITRR